MPGFPNSKRHRDNEKKRLDQQLDHPSIRKAFPDLAPAGGDGFDSGSIQFTAMDVKAFETAAMEFEPKPDYDADPALWGLHRLNEYYHYHQRLILNSLRDFRYTAVKSCHGAGKSFIAARAAAKWLDLYPPGEAFVVSTAPTAAQVSAILWREIQKAHKKGSLIGHITTAGYPQWKIDGELVGYGRKPSDYDDSAFQGIHARYVLVLIDEACGVDKALFDAADALATNEYARVLAIGNPDNPASHFATVCKADSGWNTIRIDGLATPNFTEELVANVDCPQCRSLGRETNLLQDLMEEEGVPYNTEEVPHDLRPMLLSPLWVEERLHRWVGWAPTPRLLAKQARESALFTAKVRGLFPDSGTEGVVPLGWVEAAMQRHREWQEAGSPEPVGRRLLGVDVAREGEDDTCLAIRIGEVTQEVRRYRKADTMETTGFVVGAYGVDPDNSLPVVDVIGVGGGVVDRLRELNIPVLAFNAAGSAKGLTDRTGEMGFTNLRAAAWWNLRELLDPSRGSRIALPDSEILKADLTAPKWRVMSGGKIQIESKADIKKRLGRSPDEGDSVVMAHWLDASPLDGSQPDALDWFEDAPPDVYSWGIERMVDLP